VNFFLGTDQHGFLMGCINGNSRMPFPLVTLSDVAEGQWHQVVLVKDAQGAQQFYHNGALVHTDAEAEAFGQVWPFIDTADGEAVRLTVPLGGRIGEVWVLPRELSPDEVRQDFERKRRRYMPALPVERVFLREMDARPEAGLWRTQITAQTWPGERERIRAGVLQLLGPFPTNVVPLDPRIISETNCGAYVRKKISIQVQPGDRMPAWLLVPTNVRGRVPAVVCFYGTTSGAGKDTTVGLSGGKPGSPPIRNRAFAIDMAQAGFVALAPDFLRDGERVPPSGRPYDTADFYSRFPEWSCVGKDIWDTMRTVDYLQTLPFVDGERIGMAGHSYGGHTTIFASALEPRIKAAFASGPVSDFRGHGMHWAVPKGAGNSQSLPNLRPYVLDPALPIPAEFYEWTALMAPRPLWVNQAVGERRPHEEENHAAVRQVYEALSAGQRVHYAWCAGDHDFPPEARRAAVQWFKRWLDDRAR
jgi:dienelactone hydrolase